MGQKKNLYALFTKNLKSKKVMSVTNSMFEIIYDRWYLARKCVHEPLTNTSDTISLAIKERVIAKKRKSLAIWLQKNHMKLSTNKGAPMKVFDQRK